MAEKSRPAREALLSNSGDSRSRKWSKPRWEDNVKADAGIIGLKCWTVKAKEVGSTIVED